MCGRFVTVIPAEELKAIFDLIERPMVEPRYNVAPSQKIAVVRQNGDGQNRLDFMRWGLIPPWADDIYIGFKLINARSETVHEKHFFRHAVRHRRCLIPSSGFYERVRRKDQETSVHPYARRVTNGLCRTMCLTYDACATRDLTFNGTTVPAAQVHASFMAALGAVYAQVKSTDEILENMSASE